MTGRRFRLKFLQWVSPFACASRMPGYHWWTRECHPRIGVDGHRSLPPFSKTFIRSLQLGTTHVRIGRKQAVMEIGISFFFLFWFSGFLRKYFGLLSSIIATHSDRHRHWDDPRYVCIWSFYQRASKTDSPENLEEILLRVRR